MERPRRLLERRLERRLEHLALHLLAIPKPRAVAQPRLAALRRARAVGPIAVSPSGRGVPIAVGGPLRRQPTLARRPMW